MKKQPSNQNGKVTGCRPFSLDYTVYTFPKDIDVILNEIRNSPKVYAKRDQQVGSIYYRNICASFDTETTSTYDKTGTIKIATMYVWMFSVNGRVIVGRTWEQFKQFINEIHKITSLNDRLMVYVHNFGFDFAFMCRHLKWYKTFCIKVREPIYCITEGGIEFRDSYILSQMSLEKIGKFDPEKPGEAVLQKYRVSKKVGDLDYSLVRGTSTPLTDAELGYCINDCLVLDAYIQEKIEQEGSINKIPLTSTGYVRRFLKNKCYPRAAKRGYKRPKEAEMYELLMKKLTIDPEEYPMLKRAFMGGFTHANSLYVGSTLRGHIDSFDFTSSYPAVILSEVYPMSKAIHYDNVSRETFDDIIKNKLSIMDIKFNELNIRDDAPDCYISVSKGRGKNVIENNGRVAKADYFVTTITNVDFEIIGNLYEWESFQVGHIIAYEKDFLPKPIIEGVLELYKAKTELKGIESMALEYQLKKAMLNAVYGCMVTDIVKDLVEYEDDWKINITDPNEAIVKYNESKNRFLYYPWGVFVTAYARRNLFMGIMEFGNDYIYSDTDSIKCLNADKHLDFINYYNTLITNKINTVLTNYNIDIKEACPKNQKGVEKPIGVWDWETENEKYTIFKTLGAKRYMYTQSDGIHITIAGLGKKSGGKYISIQDNPYEFFNDEMSIPGDDTGKLLHTYIDNEVEGEFVDYLGNKCYYREKGGVHLEKNGYSLSISKQFKEYLSGRYDGCRVMSL